MKKIFLLLVIAFSMIACEKETRDCPVSTEKIFTQNGFIKVRAGEIFQIKIKRGPSFQIIAKGCANDLEDLVTTLEPGGYLDIHYNRYKNGRYRVDIEITMPSLSQINLAGASNAVVNGFENQTTTLTTVLSGTAKSTIDRVPANVSLDLSGASALTLMGNATELKGNIAGDARLHAYGATATNVDIATAGTSKAFVVPEQNFTALASGDSRIYYKGNPINKDIEESGTGRVIHE